ncbi:WxL domain-containing protein [Vagococcus zengguangii]|uniref:WxL domain-containing protein n=1 Tax=Vagococcus zengguangii TaxID=2571750 RepID=UPI001107D777|nr:WxL domain-containing protein [Vagococcus zengguangii]TLG78276.1 WxL domain-containing protein [Vagococcus zengguangii]
MKATKVISTVLLSTLVLGTVSTGVFAEEIPQEINTEAGVGFQSGDGEVTPPVDPENPNPTDPIYPVDPVDPEIEIPTPENKGPLSLDFASKLYFGNQKISTKDQTYFAAAQLFKEDKDSEVYNETTNYVQVTDSRGLIDGKWQLNVSQPNAFTTPITDSEGLAQSKELEGAKIVFTNVNANSEQDTTSAKPHVLQTFTLEKEASFNVTTADNSQNQGFGTWVTRFGTAVTPVDKTNATVEIEGVTVDTEAYDEETHNLNTDIRLEVPGKATKLNQAYTTQLVWSLTDTPANTETTL